MRSGGDRRAVRFLPDRQSKGLRKAAKRAHADAAERMFWTNTMLPRAEWIAEEWTIAVVRRFENDRSLGMSEARAAALGEVEARWHERGRPRASSLAGRVTAARRVR